MANSAYNYESTSQHTSEPFLNGLFDASGNIDYQRQLEMLGFQNSFTAEQNALNRRYNAEQSQLQRNWEEQMSNTAYQRAVADMKAAGLNPALMYGSGSSASTPSGSSASYGGGSSSGAGISSARTSSKGWQALLQLAGTAASVATSAMRVGAQLEVAHMYTNGWRR